MTTADRYALLAKLPDAGQTPRYLAIERGAVPRAVIVSATPAAVADDPARLDALVRDAEAAARLRHPHVLPSLGLETLGDGTALVEAYRAGVTLRELLAAGGRLPPPIAARVAADLCAAVERIQGFATGDGRPLVHGHVDAEHVWIADGGEALLCGLGAAGGTPPVEDVRGAAAVLGECLSGEPVGERFDAPGVPAAVASVVSRYRSPASAVLGAAALAEAVAAAVKPGLAAREAVAAWVDAVLPPGQSVRAERATLLEEALGPEARFGGAAAGSRGKAAEVRPPAPAASEAPEAPAAPEEPAEEIAVDQIIDTATLRAKTIPMLRAVTDEDILATNVEPTPAAIRAPAPPDAARTFPTPPRRPDRARTLALVAAGCALAGFAGGFAASRAAAPPASPPGAVSSPSGAAPPRVPDPEGPGVPADAVRPAPAPRPPRKEPAKVAKPARPAKREPAAPVAVPATASGVRPGVLTVNAPEGATVLLDGKLLGTGTVRREIPAGRHRIEVRLGDAKVTEGFELEPGGTYTYEVTPTQP